MDKDSIIDEIMNSTDNKQLIRTLASLKKEFKPTIQSQLWRLNKLCYDLYFRGKKNLTISLCRLIEEVSFKGNFNIWSPIESTLLLKWWILKDQQENKNLELTINQLMEVSVYEWSDAIKTRINRKVRKRRAQQGTLLNYDKINTAIANKNKHDEYDYRSILFSELLFIYFNGGLESKTESELILEIETNLNKIRALL